MASQTNLPLRQARPQTDSRRTIPCQFDLAGQCRKGASCAYMHAPRLGTTAVAAPLARSSPPRDTRADVPCRFFASGTCSKGAQCPFLHNVDAVEEKQEEEKEPDHGPASEESWCRELSGAVVAFGDGAVVTKVSFASDFSAVRLRRLPANTTTTSVVALLATHGLVVSEECVRVLPPSADDPGHCVADVRVEDALFSTHLCALPAMKAFLAVAVNSVALPQATTSVRRVDSKKVHVSWHKPTKTVWLNFESSRHAGTVAGKFRNGIYTISGQRVRAEDPKRSDRGYRFTTETWTVILSDVPAPATERHVIHQISRSQRPKHVELGNTTSRSVDMATASASIQSLLQGVGPLEWWEESTGALTASKRHKAKARFLHEADAAQAVDKLNNQLLPFNHLDRLTVELVHAARLKVAARVYDAAAGAIKSHVHDWKAQHVVYTAYAPAQGFRVLKIEGSVRQNVAQAKAVLETALAGEVAVQRDGETPLWSAALASRAMRDKLKQLEGRFGVAILCDKRKAQVRLVGTAQGTRKAQSAIVALVKAEPAATAAVKMRAIPLDAAQLAWAFRGGYRAIAAAVGSDKTRLDVVSTPKRILVSGESEYQTAMGMLGQDVSDSQSVSGTSAGICSVCWTEAENALQTPCQHVYCAGCFEELCHAGAGTEKGVCCVGEAATCGVPLPLSVLQMHLASAALEDVLEESFTAHVSRHVDELRHCPTADCGQIYRAAAATTAAATPLFTCPDCLSPVCRACHVVHEGISCAESRDRATGGYKALEVVKKNLGIKNCPKCATLIEKVSGCNHMTCLACGAHICWVCLKTFPDDNVIYDHMRKAHGGHGGNYMLV